MEPNRVRQVHDYRSQGLAAGCPPLRGANPEAGIFSGRCVCVRVRFAGEASAEPECESENQAAVADFAGQGSGPLCGEREVSEEVGEGMLHAFHWSPDGKPSGS